MATLIKTDGSKLEIQPQNGLDFQLDELQKFVDGKHPINDVYQDCYGVATFASSIPWWTVARPWTLIHVNGWRMSYSGYPGTRITVKSSVNSCQTSGQNNPSRINLTQLWPT